MRTVTPCYPLGRRPTYIHCFLQIRLLEFNSCGDICLRSILKRMSVTIVGPYHYYCKINTNSSAKTLPARVLLGMQHCLLMGPPQRFLKYSPSQRQDVSWQTPPRFTHFSSRRIDIELLLVTKRRRR